MNTNSDSPLSRQRRKWFSTEMHTLRAAFTSDKELLLFTGTWNVNGRSPEPSADLKQWLFPRSTSSQPFDVYMLGLQEVQPLAGVDAVRTDTLKGSEWRDRIKTTLGSDYDHIAEHQLVGILVLVFLRKNHGPFLSDVRRSYAATGFFNAVGNKGGVAIRFQLYDQTISCVACHLSAHTDNVERRNQDFRDVVRKAVFTEEDSLDGIAPSRSLDRGQPPQPLPIRHNSTPGGSSQAPSSSMSRLPAVAAGTGSWLGSVASQAASALSDISAGANAAALADPNALKILEHDAVFWLGDLNYRVDAPLDDVMKWIKDHNWEALYCADQLQHQMKICEVFTGFKEGPLKFAPTYKLERHSDNYAVDENGDMKRVPAYTDRILWRTGGGREGGVTKLRLREYNSAKTVYSSDHRPVYAMFKMTFGVEDVRKKKNVEAKVNRELDSREANFRPSLQFSTSTIDFGDVFFNRECTRQLKVRNLGGVAATVIVSPSREKPKWLVFDESKWRSFEIPPGKTRSIDIGIRITKKDGTANIVSAKGCVLESVLNIVAEPGKLSERIRLKGRYVATSLGLSLELLSMLAEPVLSLRRSNSASGDRWYNHHFRDPERDHRNVPGPVPLPVPKELWLLVDALHRVHPDDHDMYMNRYPGIFLRDAEEVETQRVLSFVDRGESIPDEMSGYAIGTCMLDILKNLDEPVIPRYATRRAIEAGHTEDPEMVHAVVNMLPPLNANVFWYLIGFLCETPSVRLRQDRGQEVADVFGRVLLAGDGNSSPKNERCRAAFVLGAIRYQQQLRAPAYSATIDLPSPDSHPKNLAGDIAG